MFQSRWLSKYLISMSAGLGLAIVVATLLAATVRSAPLVACAVTPGSGPYPTIQAAVDDSSCDPINVPAGLHAETVSISRSLTLQGAGQTSTIINGGATGRVVTIDGSGIIVYLNAMHITNGDATVETVDPRIGGGILVANGAILHGTNLLIDRNWASSQTTGFGGGVAINTGSGYLTNTVIYSNTANLRGGGLTGSGRGGGLYVNDGNLRLISSQVLTNLAVYRAASGDSAAGGGLFIAANTQVYLSGNTWYGNIARGRNSDPCDLTTCSSGLDTEGGGAVSVAFPTGTSDVVVFGDTFIGNVANDVNPLASNNSGRGGAMSFNTSNTGGQITATLVNVTMSQNIAATISNGGSEEGRGGAIYARHTDITVERSHIYDNQAAGSGDGSGGGFYAREPLAEQTVNIINTVLAGNLASGVSGEGAQIYVNHTNLTAENITRIVHSTLADDTLNPKEALFYHGTDGL